MLYTEYLETISIHLHVMQCSELNAHFSLISELTVLPLSLAGRAADCSRDAMSQERHDIRNMLESLSFGKLSLKYY